MIKTANDANIRDPSNGNVPLHIASQNGHLHIVKMLLAKGADANSQNNGGQTPLHMAVSYDYDEVSAALKGAGADQNIKNNEGFPAKFGLDGAKDPASPDFAMAKFVGAEREDEILAALDLMKKQPSDKALVVQNGMKKKKAVGANWSPSVQEKFAALVASI